MATGQGEGGERAAAWDKEALEARVVRYGDLAPCRNAFIDTRTPGSDAKENFTIIGPGVAENPEQHVHISEAHGFNIGGARQPPGCVNSQHSHDTAEVFVVHTGRWRFTVGEHGEDVQIEAEPGDIVSFPIHAFRGFENVGDETGFLWSVLGGDDPGRVLWAPKVFEMAEKYGLILLENGALVDTTLGQTPPPGVGRLPPTSREAIARLRRIGPEDAKEIIAFAPRPRHRGEEMVIGPGGQLPPAEGFTVSRLVLDAGEAGAASSGARREVVFVQDGSAEVRAGETTIALRKGDTMTLPVGLRRSYQACDDGAELILVRSTD
jgi:quercetin dioxygenase-like cupin family protein